VESVSDNVAGMIRNLDLQDIPPDGPRLKGSALLEDYHTYFASVHVLFLLMSKEFSSFFVFKWTVLRDFLVCGGSIRTRSPPPDSYPKAVSKINSNRRNFQIRSQ
jgi:hypothetical protein